MAKSTSFFNLRRGSTKSHTYSVYQGIQITKDRVSEVANPRTSGQMEQRLAFTTASRALAVLRPIVDHSFEGVQYGTPSTQLFMAKNVELVKASLDSPAGEEAFNLPRWKQSVNTQFGEFVIANGSLTPSGLFEINSTSYSPTTPAGVSAITYTMVSTQWTMPADEAGVRALLPELFGEDTDYFTAVALRARTALGPMPSGSGFQPYTAEVLTDAAASGDPRAAMVLGAKRYSLAGAEVTEIDGGFLVSFPVAEAFGTAGNTFTDAQLTITSGSDSSVSYLLSVRVRNELYASTIFATAIILSSEDGLRSFAQLDIPTGLETVNGAESIDTWPVSNVYYLNGGNA